MNKSISILLPIELSPQKYTDINIITMIFILAAVIGYYNILKIGTHKILPMIVSKIELQFYSTVTCKETQMEWQTV